MNELQHGAQAQRSASNNVPAGVALTSGLATPASEIRPQFTTMTPPTVKIENGNLVMEAGDHRVEVPADDAEGWQMGARLLVGRVAGFSEADVILLAYQASIAGAA